VGGGRKKSQAILMAFGDCRPLRVTGLIGLRIYCLVAIRFLILDAVPAVIPVLLDESTIMLPCGYIAEALLEIFRTMTGS
jgi:hypothetical protein